MSNDNDNAEAARKRAQAEQIQYPSGGPLTQNQTGYSWDTQKAYENQWNKK